jgi:DNA-binding NarL/FixJ family response regulator
VKKAIIFEDFELIAEVWKLTLQSMGYSDVSIVPNPERNDYLNEKINADLILMDINLAGELDGFELTKLLISNNKDLKIIFVSLHAQLQNAFMLGAVGYVVKDSPLKELKEAIQIIEAGGTYVCEQMKGFTI